MGRFISIDKNSDIHVHEEIDFAKTLKISDTTDSTTVATGSIVTAGGIGVAKNITSGGLTVTGLTTTPRVLVNRSAQAASGISFYNSGYNTWQQYMGPAGAAGQGVKGNITAPTGTLVNSWGMRSIIENYGGSGWTWESGVNGTGTPSIVAELRSSDGAFKTSGTIHAPSLSISGDSYLKGPVYGPDVNGLIIQGDGNGTVNDATATLMLRSSGTSTGPAISFHRPGAYASKIWFGTDNAFHFGGWSDGVDSASLKAGDLSLSAVNVNFKNGNSVKNGNQMWFDSAKGAFRVGTDDGTHWSDDKVGNYSHAEGENTIASNTASHAEGYNTAAGGSCSHAEGAHTTAEGSCSHAEGFTTAASGSCSHAEGMYTSTNYKLSSHIMGQYGNATDNRSWHLANGASNTAKGLAAKICGNGWGYSDGGWTGGGADYAEYFEWEDGNPDAEDRAGFFVTLTGSKIRKAESSDQYIIGIISGNPSIIGNDAELNWNGRYLCDRFDRKIYEDVTIPAVVNDEGEIIIPEHIETQAKINPHWDTSLEYDPRQKRSEWDTVGMLGQIIVRDDGTCIVDGYCTPGNDGIATDSSEGYRVIKRIDENTVKVIFR